MALPVLSLWIMSFPFSRVNKASAVHFCQLNSIYYSQLFYCHLHVWMFIQIAVASVVSIQSHSLSCCLDGLGLSAYSCSESINWWNYESYSWQDSFNRDQASIPQVEFEPTIPVSEWVKIFCTLNHAAVEISNILYIQSSFTTYYFQFLTFS